MDAITFLVKEHDKIRASLKKLSKKTGTYSTKKRMFDNFCNFLICHEKMEQAVWYPVLKNNKKLKKEVKHLITEEKDAGKVIKKLEALKMEEKWEAKFPKLKKAVQHHAHEEEHELFPNVEETLAMSELQKIGKKMQAFKKKYKNKKFV